MVGPGSSSSVPRLAVAGTPLFPRDHLCLFYRGKEERDSLILPFLKEGLREGNVCFSISREGEGDLLAASLGPSADTDLLQVAEPQDTYLKTGTFSGPAMLMQLDDWSNRTFADRSDRFARIVTDMSWAQPFISPSFIAGLVTYEAAVTRWVRAFPQVAICTYDLDLFGGETVIPMIRAHAKVWMGNTLVENPYYLGAE